jgi:hypothetical protein
VFDAMCTVNAETNTVPVSGIARLKSFKEMCENYLRNSAQSDDAEPA